MITLVKAIEVTADLSYWVELFEVMTLASVKNSGPGFEFYFQKSISADKVFSIPRTSCGKQNVDISAGYLLAHSLSENLFDPFA